MNSVKIKELKEEFDYLIKEINKCVKDGEFNPKNELNCGILDFSKKLSKLDEITELINLDNKAKEQKEKNKIRSFINKNKDKILELHNNMCDVCGLDIYDILEIHHILPISCNGDNSLDNLACLCPNCHSILHKMINDCKKDIDNTKLTDLIKEKLTYNAYNNLQNIFIKSVKKGVL